MGRLAIVGGTGPEGIGLGYRFAMAGEEVVIGSRKAERGEETAREMREKLAGIGCKTPVSGTDNATAVDGAELVVLAFPYSGVAELLPALAPKLAGKTILDVVNPLTRVNKIFTSELVPEGSAAEAIQRALPDSPVVAAFKNESAEELVEIHHPVEGDVIVCGDHAGAKATIIDLIKRIPNYRAVDAGALLNARVLEGITAMLLNINRRYKAVTSIRILGLDGKTS
ncbi:MAG: NADPH-dependent F420 reductase [Candidatus Binatia bacterium]